MAWVSFFQALYAGVLPEKGLSNPPHVMLLLLPRLRLVQVP
jgi:hypothetical protein